MQVKLCKFQTCCIFHLLGIPLNPISCVGDLDPEVLVSWTLHRLNQNHLYRASAMGISSRNAQLMTKIRLATSSR